MLPISTTTSSEQSEAITRASARRALALLLAINLVNYIDRYVLASVVPKIKTELLSGATNIDTKVGFLAQAFLLSYMIASPVFGWLADRSSRWLLVGIGVIAWSLASGASGLAETYVVLLITRMFVGIGEAAYGPVAPTIISELFPVERRGRVLAWFYLAMPVGSALGYTFGGLMAQHWDWRWAFYLSLPPGILLGVLCLFMREPRKKGAVGNSAESGSGAAHHHATWEDYKSILRTPSYIFNTIGMTLMTFAVGGIAFWMPDYIHSFRNAGELGDVSFKFGAITAVAGLFSTLAGGWLGDKLRPRFSGSYFLVSGGGMLLGVPFFLLALFVPFPYAWGMIFLAEFCLFFNTGPSNTILANVTQPAVRASAFALNIFVIHALGDVISPPLIGWITDLNDGNMNAGFAVVTVAIFFSGVFWMLGAKYLAHDTEKVSINERRAS
jgi:MFS transporter, Spinster family, sphingosine-1-phosphate transporter